MIATFAARVKKAGLSGLLFATVLFGATPAAAQPLAVEIVSAELGFDQRTRQPLVSFRMSPVTAKHFFELTSANVGRKMEVRVDGRTVMAPVIREPIMGGSGQIMDNAMTADTARDLARRLMAGKSKVEIEIVNE